MLSGFSALSYQIIWVRTLTLFVGGGSMAVPIVLTAFMGGLGLGGAMAARALRPDKAPGPLLRAYGWIEIGIGVYALLFPLLCRLLQPAYATLYTHTGDGAGAYDPLSALLTIALLLVPTTLMGATLPVMAGCLAATRETVGTHLGRLYGLNTLGAALGALACGFWLLPQLGVSASTGVAAALNLLGGGVALVLGKSCAVTAAASAPRSREPAAVRQDLPPQSFWPLGALLAVAGFSAMGYEVVWTRLISLLVGPTTYSFTIVLVTFITGLGLGSLLLGPWSDRVRNPRQLLLWTQLGAVACALLASQFLGQAQLLMAKLLFVHRDQFLVGELAKAGVLFAVLLPTTVLQGAALPVSVKLLTSAGPGVGVATGRLYTWNTLGAVLGASVVGFVLVPRLGQASTLSLLAAMQAGMAILVVAACGPRRTGTLIPLMLGGAAALTLCAVLPRWDASLLGRGAYHRFERDVETLRFISYWEALWKGPALLQGPRALQRALSIEEDHGGYVAVLEAEQTIGPPVRQLTVSGKVDASSGSDMATQTMLAHFPMLNHPGPEGVLVIGLGSGVTAGEVLHYPVKQLDLVEISSAVVRASHFFTPWNNRALSDPRTRVIVQDARAHLTLSSAQYDVIISEPSNPWMAGIANLYTREFFTKVRAHLRSGGIFAQWVHSYEMDWESFALLGRTLRSVFPDTILLQTGRIPEDCVFLCFERSGASLDFALAESNLVFARRSGNVRIPTADILAYLVVHDDLASFFPPGPLQTDDHPRLEYQAPRNLHLVDRQELVGRLATNRRAGPVLSAARRRLDSVSGQLDLAEFFVSLDQPPFGLIDLSQATPQESERYAKLLVEHARRTGIDFAKVGAWERSVTFPAQETGIRERLAASAGGPGHARAATVLGLGNHRMIAGDFPEGSRLLTEAVALLPSHDPAMQSLQFAHELSGRYEAAATVVRRRMDNGVPTPQLLSDLARYLGRLGGDRTAWTLIEQALALDPDSPQALVAGSHLLAERRDFTRAAEFALKATRAAPREPATHVALVRTYLQAGRTSEARTALIWGLGQCPNAPELQQLRQQLDPSPANRLTPGPPAPFR